MTREVQSCCECAQASKMLELASSLVVTLSRKIDEVTELAELQKFVLTRYSQKMLEKDIFAELEKYEAEQKRRRSRPLGGFKVEAI